MYKKEMAQKKDALPKRWSTASAWSMREAPIMAHIAADKDAQYIPTVTNGGQRLIR